MREGSRLGPYAGGRFLISFWVSKSSEAMGGSLC
jgi:hypothetical protein